MSSRVALLGLVVALGLAGCGGEDASTTDDPGEIAIELEQVEEGVEGVRATLSFEGADSTHVRIDGLDEGQPAGGGPNPAWLRRGSCDELSDVVADLGTLDGPVTEKTVDVGLAALMEGEYAIAVGLPDTAGTGGADGSVVACGNVPDEAPD